MSADRSETVKLPILYSFRRCPYAMRARMALAVAGQFVELREVSLKAKPEAMIAASAKATVPVLMLPEGRVIDESLDIMHWALAMNDPLDLLAPGEAMSPLIAANDGPFKHHLDRTKYPHQFPADDWEGHRAAALALLMPAEARLRQNDWLFGARLSLADIALFPFIRQFAALETVSFASLPFPGLHRWLAALASSDLFGSIMIKRPVWYPGQEAVIFP